jgi:hypothetical protein
MIMEELRTTFNWGQSNRIANSPTSILPELEESQLVNDRQLYILAMQTAALTQTEKFKEWSKSQHNVQDRLAIVEVWLELKLIAEADKEINKLTTIHLTNELAGQLACYQAYICALQGKSKEVVVKHLIPALAVCGALPPGTQLKLMQTLSMLLSQQEINTNPSFAKLMIEIFIIFSDTIQGKPAFYGPSFNVIGEQWPTNFLPYKQVLNLVKNINKILEQCLFKELRFARPNIESLLMLLTGVRILLNFDKFEHVALALEGIINGINSILNKINSEYKAVYKYYLSEAYAHKTITYYNLYDNQQLLHQALKYGDYALQELEPMHLPLPLKPAIHFAKTLVYAKLTHAGNRYANLSLKEFSQALLTMRKLPQLPLDLITLVVYTRFKLIEILHVKNADLPLAHQYLHVVDLQLKAMNKSSLRKDDTIIQQLAIYLKTYFPLLEEIKSQNTPLSLLHI